MKLSALAKKYNGKILPVNSFFRINTTSYGNRDKRTLAGVESVIETPDDVYNNWKLSGTSPDNYNKEFRKVAEILIKGKKVA